MSSSPTAPSERPPTPPSPSRQSQSAEPATGGWTDPAYQAALSADWRTWRLPPSPYAIFQEMEDKDAHFFAALQTRKLAVLAHGWTLEPGDPADPRSAQALDLCNRVIAQCPDFESLLIHLLDALGKGLALAEIEWQILPPSVAPSSPGESPVRVVPRRIVGRWPGQYAYDTYGQLHRLTEPGHQPSGQHTPLLPRPGEPFRPTGSVPVPPRKIIAYAFQGSPAQPYGISLAMKVYWYAFFKRHTVKFWALFNERFGSPTAIARYTSTASPDEVARLESLIATLQTDSGIILPEGIQLDLLEAGRSAAGSTHRDLADWCNDEISKAVLGQTLTITEGRRSGSLSLGEVHNQVRREYTAADARSLGACLSATLLRWITDFNLGPHYPSPRMRFAAERPTDSAHDLALDERLVRLGVPLPVDWFHQRYSRPMPADGQRTLRYDDANLYQYHLQFGILRINEVRASLGLPPVPWGDGPPQSISQPAPSNQPTPGRDQTDGDPIESALDEDRNDRRAR